MLFSARVRHSAQPGQPPRVAEEPNFAPLEPHLWLLKKMSVDMIRSDCKFVSKQEIRSAIHDDQQAVFNTHSRPERLGDRQVQVSVQQRTFRAGDVEWV